MKIYVIQEVRRGFYVGPKYNPDHEWTMNIFKAKWYKRPGDAANAIAYEMGNTSTRFIPGVEYCVVTYRVDLNYESAKKIVKKG